MTEKKSNKSPEQQETPQAAENTEAKSNFAKARSQGGGNAKLGKKKSRVWLWLSLLVLVGGAGIWAWLNWPQLQSKLSTFLPAASPQVVEEKPQPEPEPAPAPREPAKPEPGPSEALQRESAALRAQLQQQNETIQRLQQQLGALQRSVTAQGSRLSELGNISRQDWQLAEADYLLRLANQRLLLEHDSRTALGLVEEVDNILRTVDLPDLFGVRQQLARDLAELKLVENIDREGLYLRLRALEEQLLRASIQPEFDLASRDTGEEVEPATASDVSPLRQSWQNFRQFLRQAVRIRDGNIDPVLLSPQSEARFRQSLRLNMEQAELALLRENETIYKDSLNRARQLLLDYGIDNNQRQVLARELEELAEQPVKVELPSLSTAQSALHNYIERLHKASPQAPAGTDDRRATQTEAAEIPGGETP